MDAGSLKQRTAFPSSVEVGASFPPIPNPKSRISVPESGPSFAELDRGDSPIPPLPFDPATLTTSKKRGRSTMEKSPAHKPKKAKKSNKSVVQQVTPPEVEPGRNHRRIGDLREIDLKYFQVGLIHPCNKFWNLIFNSPHVRNSLQRTALYDR